MNEAISSLDASAIKTLEKITICDINAGERRADKTAVDGLSNGELLNIIRISTIALNTDDPENIFTKKGLVNSSIFELVDLTLKGRLLDAIEQDRNTLLTEGQNTMIDFASLTSTDWAKLTRASRIINDGLSYLAKESFIENARLAKSTKTTKYLKGTNKNNTRFFLDGGELELTSKHKKKMISGLKKGAKGKNGITIAAIGEAEILKKQPFDGKSLLIVERTDDTGKSLLIATDKVDFPNSKAERGSLAKKIAYDQLPTADLPLHSESKYPYMNRLTKMYVKHKNNPLVAKIIRKIPVAGTAAGIVDATKQFVAGDWLSGTMTLLGEVVKGGLAIPVGIYNLTEIGLHLSGYEITKVFKEGGELLGAKYNQLTLNSNTLNCEQKVDISPNKCDRIWSDDRNTWIDDCKINYASTFTYAGTLKGSVRNRTNDKNTNNTNYSDTFTLTYSGNKDMEEARWLPELEISNPRSNHYTVVTVSPKDPNSWRHWAFIYYDQGYASKTLECHKSVGFDDRTMEEIKDLLAERHQSPGSYGRTYINGDLRETNKYVTGIDLSEFDEFTVNLSSHEIATEDGRFPGMGSGIFCNDTSYDGESEVNYTLKLVEI